MAATTLRAPPSLARIDGGGEQRRPDGRPGNPGWTAGLRLGGRDITIVDGASEIMSLIFEREDHVNFTAVDVLGTPLPGHAGPDVMPGFSLRKLFLAGRSASGPRRGSRR